MNKEISWLSIIYSGLCIGVGITGLIYSNNEYSVPISIFSMIWGLLIWIYSLGDGNE